MAKPHIILHCQRVSKRAKDPTGLMWHASASPSGIQARQIRRWTDGTIFIAKIFGRWYGTGFKYHNNPRAALERIRCILPST